MSRKLPRLGMPAAAVFAFIVLVFLFKRLDRYDVYGGTSAQHAAVINGKILPAGDIARNLDAIFNGNPHRLDWLECPALNTTRYEPLKPKENPEGKIRYFFALNLRENLPILPRLIASIVEAIRFLGPENCALSIVEGNSPDGTADVVQALRPGFDALGARFFFQSTPLNPMKHDRVKTLAEIRNRALTPLLDRDELVDKDTTILFLNDVSACPEDILELAFQRRRLGADMTCAMDWNFDGDKTSFYDVWISRDISGESFFRIADNGGWEHALNLFFNTPDTKARFEAHRPFQVFSCWNGAVAFGAQPLLDEKNPVRFRGVQKDECYQGEPELFCKDLWFRGYNKIAVVPTVNFEYSTERGAKIKNLKGFVSDLVANQDAAGDAIKWQKNPPEKVRCMPTWTTQGWQPWNFSLVKDKE